MNDSIRVHVADSIFQARMESLRDTTGKTEVEKGIMTAIENMSNMSTEELIWSVLDGFVGFGLKLLAALLIYFVGVWIIRRIKRTLAKVFLKRDADPAIASFVESFATVALTIILSIIVIGTLGIETTSLAALLAAGGMAIGMALSGTVQNLAGGIMLLVFKPFKAGDFIETQGVSGTVDEIRMTTTQIHTSDNKVIVIPNGSLSSSIINNYSQRRYRRLEWMVGLDYGCDSAQVKKLLRDILMADQRVLNLEKGAPADPLIELYALGDSAVQFVMRAWVLTEDYWNVYFSVNEAIYNELPAHGINFPYPQMDVHLH
nr:mechanosensitive ion channel [Bacteroidales bacterium]